MDIRYCLRNRDLCTSFPPQPLVVLDPTHGSPAGSVRVPLPTLLDCPFSAACRLHPTRAPFWAGVLPPPLMVADSTTCNPPACLAVAKPGLGHWALVMLCRQPGVLTQPRITGSVGIQPDSIPRGGNPRQGHQASPPVLCAVELPLGYPVTGPPALRHCLPAALPPAPSPAVDLQEGRGRVLFCPTFSSLC